MNSNNEETNLRISLEQIIAGYLHRNGDIFRAIEIIKDVAEEHEYKWEDVISNDDYE